VRGSLFRHGKPARALNSRGFARRLWRNGDNQQSTIDFFEAVRRGVLRFNGGMRAFRPLGFCLLAFLAAPLARAADLFPFVLPWDDASKSVTNVSAWLDKPAGGSGFVEARDGHLFEGKKRIRFFGVNVAFGGNFPKHEDAEKVAARMAKFGINCVRFHHMDTGFAPAGLLEKDKKTFNAEALDRLDYFIAELKKNGIYANLNLHVGREYPGFKKWNGASNFFKGVDNFFPPFIEQQHEYARTLLTHVNPYTGKAYVDEPAVAFIEINNENGLIMEWNNGTLDGMPDPFAAAFREQWNAWLQKKYGSQEKLAEAWQPGAEPLGEEMLKPGKSAWTLEQHGEAKASVEFEPADAGAGETMHVQVTQPSVEGWHAQVVQPGVALAGGKTYTVNARATSDTPRKVAINLSQAHEPWKVLATQTVDLTGDWKDVQFSAPIAEAEEKARLTLSNLGTAPGNIWFSSVSLRPGGIVALKEGETLGAMPFFRKKEIGSRTPAAQRDWNEFLVDAESDYWTGMRQFVREELHAHSLVVGTATGFSPWIVQAKLDVVDAHGYWQHPHFPHKPWDANDWTVKNISMAGAADGGTLPGLALRRVAGKPFIVTEYNASAPNIYASEAFLELCAMAGLQDWDGLFAFAYCHRTDDWDTKRITSFFDIDQHPTKMATLPAALALFMRADIQPPANPVIAETTPAEALESIRSKGGSWVDAKAYGIPKEEAFLRAIGMRLGAQSSANVPPPEDAAILRSANGQLTWDTAAHRMVVMSSRSIGIVGNVQAGEDIDLGLVHITPGVTRQNWATINVTVMDGAHFKSARRILITATGLAENTGMQWKDAERTSVGSNWGSAPSLVEGIAAKIELPAMPKAKAWALDATGQRKTEVPLKTANGHTEIEISPEQETLWWEVAGP
jgi:hypothetical protein